LTWLISTSKAVIVGSKGGIKAWNGALGSIAIIVIYVVSASLDKEPVWLGLVERIGLLMV
jgi:hypothetical protein